VSDKPVTTLDELRRLLAESTPGEWETVPELGGSRAFIRSGARCVATRTPTSDAALIVALRNHADALLDVVEAAQDFTDAEDEWHLRHGMGRERIPYRREMDAANERLRAALARLDPKETP